MADFEIESIAHSLLAATPITIVLLDHERRVVYANLIEHGFDRSKIIGLPIDALLPEADRSRIIGLMDDVLRTGTPRTYDTRLLTPNGLVLYFVRLKPLVIDGVIRYAVLTSFEITEEDEQRKLREREHELLAALEPLNRILLAAPVAEPMFDRLLDQILTLFDCDRAFMGYPCDPTASEFSIVYERTRPEFPREKGLKLPVDASLAQRFEGALAHLGGVVRHDPECNPIPLEIELNPFQVRSMLFVAVHTEVDKPWLLGIHHCRVPRVYDAEVGLLAAIAARVGDALRAYKTQAAMRESEQRFRLLVEHAPEAMVILDTATGRFVEVNSKAGELFGRSREQLLQSGPAELSPVTQADGVLSAERVGGHIVAALAGESPVFEWQHLHASGALVECEVRLIALPHQDRGWIRGSIFDISDRKRAQREHEKLSAQLAQAQKMQAIGHLTGGVAHDFNNLLTVIGGGLEMMALESNADPKLRSYGRLALEACHRAASLTQRLLAFSRQQPLRPSTTDVAQLVRGMEGLLRRTLGETIQIEVVFSADLWLCEIDPAQLESALLNLGINARDAMPGGGHLTIDACNLTVESGTLHGMEELTPGDYVRVSVSDDGTGIAPAILSKVFEPFFTTKAVGKGSGLGLSMVYGFAKQSRGHVKIYSELGHGTTVRLLLPRSREAVATEPERATAQPILRGQQELVLVVEDDAGLRVLAVELLEQLGYRTLAAGDASAGIRLIAESPDVALLLADMVLPGGKNGVELAREVHLLRPDLPVLFMSGYTENAVIHNGRLDEGVRLLEKPFAISALALAVRRALDGT